MSDNQNPNCEVNNSFLDKCYDFFTWFDYVGPIPSITHKGKNRYKTLILIA